MHLVIRFCQYMSDCFRMHLIYNFQRNSLTLYRLKPHYNSLGGLVVQDDFVAATVYLGYHIFGGKPSVFVALLVQIPPDYKINCKYLIKYYSIMSAITSAP